MKIAVVHPTGNANVRALLRALQSCGSLAAFYTTLGFTKDDPRLRIVPKIVRRHLQRRSYELPSSLLKTRPARELLRLTSGFVPDMTFGPGIDAIYHDLDRFVAREIAAGKPRGATAVYGYEDGCRDSFREAASRGLRTLYDLPIGYWKAARTLLAEEAQLQPEWAPTIAGLRDSGEKLARKDEEIALAGTVIVASSFTKKTLQLHPGFDAPVHVVTYGAPDVAAEIPAARKSGPLRILFVGGLSQRKGLSYLFEAANSLQKAATLTVVGRRVAECRALDRELVRHRWIRSLPHREIIRLMSEHDVLVFPSLFEGFGLVILEALAQGLPVITTPHTGGPDILTDARDGFIVPIRSSQAIAEKLEFLHSDRAALAAMRSEALRTASRWPWKRHEARLVEIAAAPEAVCTPAVNASAMEAA